MLVALTLATATFIGPSSRLPEGPARAASPSMVAVLGAPLMGDALLTQPLIFIRTSLVGLSGARSLGDDPRA